VTSKKERWIAGLLLVLYLLFLTVPFVFAFAVPDTDIVFGGFFAKPIDGNSYLAKMRQGYSGNWLFVLPYTAEPGAGSAITCFTFFWGTLRELRNFH
jgi:hypothetical protein